MKFFVKYRWTDARKDLLAGVTVAAISLPQAMAYALIAGVDPRPLHFGISRTWIYGWSWLSDRSGADQ